MASGENWKFFVKGEGILSINKPLDPEYFTINQSVIHVEPPHPVRGKMVPPSRILEQQAKGLARAFLAEESYRPFQFRW